MYSLAIGALVLFALAILVLAMKMSNVTQDVYTHEGAEYRESLAARIRPAGQVYLAGEEHESAAPTVETHAEPEPVVTAMSGPQVYNAACLACHGAGIGGAPVFGDAALWSGRIAQGAATLKEHALQGYTSGTGYMPPKGGRSDLSDAEVEAAVDYMIDEASH